MHRSKISLSLNFKFSFREFHCIYAVVSIFASNSGIDRNAVEARKGRQHSKKTLSSIKAEDEQVHGTGVSSSGISSRTRAILSTITLANTRPPCAEIAYGVDAIKMETNATRRLSEMNGRGEPWELLRAIGLDKFESFLLVFLDPVDGSSRAVL